MPLGSDFNIPPYHDDFNRLNGYRKILFKPGVSVQVRELNQLQTMLQDQIEQFGDNVLKRGTIIEGCGLSYFPIFPYIKIKDTEVDETPVNVSSFNGMYVKNSSGLEALIVTTKDGFESTSPDLKTLYVKYTNSGNDGNTFQFSANQNLTVYDKGYPIFNYDIVDGSSGFSNNDTIAIVSSIAIQNSTGGSSFPGGAFLSGHIIQNNVANLEIIEANSTANSQALILRVKPLAVDLKTANSVLWTVNPGDTIRNATTANVANVFGIVGTGAEAVLVTDSLGKINSIQPVNLGSGYYVPPHVAVSITSNSSITTGQVNQLDVDALNYKSVISVADSSFSPIGTGYGAKISQGVIYQKGYFSRVQEQTIVVEKYSNTSFDSIVGFNTEEVIITSNQDESLLDNASGTRNQFAPGADRLQLNPQLIVLTPTEAQGNTDFLPIIEFSDGVPFRQRTQTVYSVVGDEMAKRTYEESGNYVVDEFQVTPKDNVLLANTANTFQVLVDPGTAYIKGYRVSTSGNFTVNVNKGSNTINLPTATSRIAYGSYIKINNVGGVFRFNFGDTVALYDTAKGFTSSISTGTNAITAPSGSIIGYARMRSLLPGDNSDEYHLYLFDIKMNSGKNFADTKSVYYNNTITAVADTILVASKTVLYDVGNGLNGLLVKNQKASKSANGIVYTYRTFETGKTANSTGYSSITPGPGQSFPYSGTLVNAQKKEFMVIASNNYQSQTNAAGSVVFTSTTANVTGTSTVFLTAFRSGDFIKVSNSTANAVAKVLNVANDTFLTLTANAPLTITSNAVLYYPNNVPIVMTRDGRSIVVEANGSITMFIGNTVANTSGGSSSMDLSVAYNIKEASTNPDAKTIRRGVFSRIRLANCGSNSTSDIYGPWPLGAPDVFRMKKVLKANGASVALTFSSETAVSNTQDFITISSHQFANGDSVLYNNTTGTSIGGLSNNTTYFVVSSNSSGIKLASTRNGSALDITSVSGGGNHTITGQRLYFANGTTGTTDVTNEFYIDHRQNEDFLDISYLVRKPNLSTLSNNDVLLVEYDAFTSTSGVKTISSYNVSDGQNVASMGNTSISTLEIPEVWGINGGYYDLRDQFDFRPAAANTIPLISEASNTSILNPTIPVYASRFTASEKKFPLNDSDLVANVSYYLGRTDRVIVDINGDIKVISGYDGKIEPPPAPNDSITLQLLEIPPYPSLPRRLSQDNIRLADTQVYNGKGSKRIFDYTIAAPIDENQREMLQVKNYTMNDVASLERRIKSLEYYVSYTLAETVAKTRFIPSSTDSGVDRWKVGFFVDAFTNYNFSEVLDPEFSSIIEDDKLTADMSEDVIEFRHETSPNAGVSVASIPYQEVTVFKQSEATTVPEVIVDNNVIIVGSNNVVSNTIANTITTNVQQITGEIKNNKNLSWSSTTQVYEDWDFTLSSTTGPVEIYMNHRARQNAISVLQSESPNGPWVEKTNSNSATGVSQVDINTKGIQSLLDNVGYYKPGVTFRLAGFVPSTTIYWMRDHHKILFTHEPSGGVYYKVRVYKGPITVSNGVYGKYSFKIFYPSDSVSYRTTFVNVNPDQYTYPGMFVDISPRNITMGGSNISDPNNQQIWTSQAMNQSVGTQQLQNNLNPTYWWTSGYRHVMNVIGLKPNTYHTFEFDGIDATTKCKQIRQTTTNTSGLLSDANGTIQFEFYNDFFVDWSSVNTIFAEQQLKSGLTPGLKVMKLTSADGSSFAESNLTVAPWIQSSIVFDTTQIEVPLFFDFAR